MSKARPGQVSEFRHGWSLVLSAMLGIGLGSASLQFYTIGLFAPELSKAFHWGFGQIQAGFVLMTPLTIFGGSTVGLLADRFGVRRIALTSMVLYACCYMSFALSSGSLLQFYGTWFAMNLLGAGTLPITWTRAVNNRFEVHKGLALGLCLMGTGLFGLLGKPITAWLIAHYGWRAAYVGTGMLTLLLAFPVALFFFRELDTGENVEERRARALERQRLMTGMTLAGAARSWRFWLLIAALLVTGFALGGPTPNMENILGSHGFSRAEAASLTPLAGGSVILGRLASGWLVDRFWAPAVAFVFLCIPAAACLMLGGASLSREQAMLSIVLIGVAAGMESDMAAFMVARYFGLRNYGSIYGIIYVFYAAGGGFAAAVFGWAYDRTHSYASVLIGSAAILVLGAASFLALGRYKYPRQDVASPGGAPGAVADG